MATHSAFIDTPTLPLNPETKLLAAFKNDTHPDKVYLAGRGESAAGFLLLTNFLSFLLNE